MATGMLHDCVGALLVRDGRILLGRRAHDRAWLPDAWDMPGGHIEAGEDQDDALRRELREELGIDPEGFRYLATLGGEAPQPWRLHVYVVTSWDGELHNRQPQEHAEMHWCTLAEAQRLLGPAHADFPRLLAQAMAP